jgi:hypothetical protein
MYCNFQQGDLHQTFGMEIGWLSSNLLSSRGLSFARPSFTVYILGQLALSPCFAELPQQLMVAFI